MNSSFSERLLKYVLGILLTVCGFLIAQSYMAVSKNLTDMNKELVSMKIQITEIQAKLIDEERVREIVGQEILKYHYSK